MNNDSRWNNRQRHRDWQDDYREGRERDDQGWGSQQGYRNDEWEERDRGGYNRAASRSGYGNSMSSMGGGQGSYHPTEGGYMHDSRYSDYGQDYRRYTDNYYRDQDNRGNRNRESRMFNESGRNRMDQPRYGQSYESAYGSGGVDNHMGYGQKGAMYREDFHGRYGSGEYDERDRRHRGRNYDQGNYGSRDNYGSQGNYGSQVNYNRRGDGGNQGYGTGRNRDMGSRSYFENTNSNASHDREDHWNIGNYGERRANENGYGYGDGYDHGDERNRNTQNYTW